MAWYCYWISKKQEEWKLALATERDSIAASGKAEFITALALDTDLDDPNAEHDKVHYTGPFYIDFDADEIDDTISQVKKFLDHLVERYSVDLSQLYFYASGKKGFHIEIPQACFISKVSAAGYKYLPAIYKEMAYAMYHDTLDLAVYTAKKGRMWRVAGFKRPETGTYKVQLTADEVRAIDEETYKTLVASPRPALAVAAPTVSSDLELLWTQCKDKVERAAKRNAGRKRDANLLAKFKGEVPPTLEQLMAGEGIKEGAGFQQIATQLAIAAHGLGMKCDDFVTKCQGLCENHVGDGSRYRSVSQRRKELARMWQYMDGNPTYDFSSAAIRALVEGPASDLNVGEETDLSKDGASDLAITHGMSISKSGIYKLTDEGFKQRISVLGMSGFSQLLNLHTQLLIGYDADVFVDGVPKGRQRLTLDHLTSKARFQAFGLSLGGVGCQITDIQVNALADVIRRVTDKEGGTVYASNHEGLDVVTLPDGERDVIWIEKGNVLSKLGQSYTYSNSLYSGGDYPFGVDLLTAPRLPTPNETRNEDVAYLTDEEMAQLKTDLHNLFHINATESIAPMLGWTIACFLCPTLRSLQGKQFPLLHVYGLAGSGKSTTMQILSHFHGHKNPPTLTAAGSATQAPILMRATGTTSIPFIIDEYREHELEQRQRSMFETLFKSVWDAADALRGGVARENGDSQVVTRRASQTSPICFIAEQRIGLTAVVLRSIVVPLTPENADAHVEYAKALGKNPKYFGSVGRMIVETLVYAERLAPEHIDRVVRGFSDQLELAYPGNQNNRPRYALAVAAAGIHLLRFTLARVFGDTFNERLTEMLDALLKPSEEKARSMIVEVKSEIVKVLADLSTLSACVEASEERRLIAERDYSIGKEWVDLHASKAYMKYAAVSRGAGMRPIYNSSEAFKAALDQYPGAKRVTDTSLGKYGIYRLDFRRMYDIDKIEPFNENMKEAMMK